MALFFDMCDGVQKGGEAYAIISERQLRRDALFLLFL